MEQFVTNLQGNKINSILDTNSVFLFYVNIYQNSPIGTFKACFLPIGSLVFQCRVYSEVYQLFFLFSHDIGALFRDCQHSGDVT